jgi:hypothetical protein
MFYTKGERKKLNILLKSVKQKPEQVQENPVSVYVPELGELNRLVKENELMRTQLSRLQWAGAYQD